MLENTNATVKDFSSSFSHLAHTPTRILAVRSAIFHQELCECESVAPPKLYGVLLMFEMFSLSSFSNLLISYTCTSSALKMWHALSRAPKCERNIHVHSVLPFAVTIHLLIYSSGQIVEKIVDWYRVIRKKWVNTYIWCTFSDLFV